MEDETTVSQETIVEETTTPSESEIETTTEPETAPADVSDQPEKVVPRSEKRIHALSQRLKEAESRAEYWERLSAPVETPTDEPAQEYYTADQIADSILKKQRAIEVEKQKAEANKEMQRDIYDTLQKHPDLETNDKLSRTVFSYAQANNMRIVDAADEIKAQIKANEERVRKEVLASKSGRIGVSTPQSGKVSNGEEKIDINSLSDEEKSANWGKILQSYTK